MTTGTPQFQMLPIADLQLSKTPAQVERRKRFDPATLAELASSIRELGVQQPIIVRRVFKNGDLRPTAYQVVAGERRVLASKQAELTTIPAMVREYTDQQVLEVQLIENLQREGLHELDEAEGYDALMKQHRFTVEDLVAKVGKSLAYVYARIKLLKLCPEVRKAFSAGKLNASVALEVARIPVHDLQRKLLKEIEREQMSFREVKDHIHRHYHLRLDQAPFDTADAELVAKAGPCGACPKRTGNQPELFGDVKSADVCTDPVCFEAKRSAAVVRQIAAAREAGKEVISGSDVKKIAPYGLDGYSHLRDHVKLSDSAHLGGQTRTYQSVIGKDVKVKYLHDERTGKLVAVAKTSDVKAALKAKKIIEGYGSDNGYRNQQAARDKKRKFETQYRRRLYDEIRPKLPAKLARAELELIAANFWDRTENESQKAVLKLWELEPAKKQYGVDHDKPMLARLAKMTDAELARFLQDLVYVRDLQVWSYSTNDSPRRLGAAAKRLKINAEKLKREMAAESKARKKPAAKKAA